MSAQDYYGGNSSAQGAPHQQHAQQGSNPYGYPQGSTPQPYYGQNEGAPHGGYSQQPYPSYDYQNQQSGGYGTQSYNYQHQHQHQHQQQQPYAPPAYDNLYPPAQHHDSDQKAPSHEQYTNQYDSSRQQGYDLYGQPSQYGPNVSVPPHEVRAGAYSQMDPNAPTGPEGERGLMGALAGGALGAYGGHKMGHGVLGALGGAYAGHKLEDAVKDKKKEKKHKHGNREERRARREERRRHRRERRGSRDSSSSSSSSSSDSDSDKEKRKHGKYKYAAAGAGAYAASHHSNRDAGRHGGCAGNFSGSASNITLDRDYDLIALCVDRHGKEKLSSIDLNDCLTNEWGHFRWARGGNAFASAKNAHLVDGGRVLEADLADGRGGWNRSRIVLDERIGNEDGELVLV